MPGVLVNGAVSRKRKHVDGAITRGVKPRKAPKQDGDTSQARIVRLEGQIWEGREHYNNIVELQSYAHSYDASPEAATLAAVALCRVFCRLTAAEALVKRSDAPENEAQVAAWLQERCKDYVSGLLDWIGSDEASQESTALTLLMRLVKAEGSQGSRRSEQAWKTESRAFYRLIRILVEKTAAAGARQEFVEKYVEEHDDVRYYTFLALRQYLKDPHAQTEETVGNAIDMLAQIEGVPESDDQLEDWYGEPPSPESRSLVSLTSHRRIAQDAWLCIFRAPLTPTHRKRLVGIATSHILPWFPNRLELLADFLTDSFSAGGNLSLLALSSIFHLMTRNNLDYPDFYTKLYSLLTEDLMHSKHRSHFFRLLATFLASEHLPATMVASFIKRLARLSLQAPPAAIVWIVPWTYNTLKSHPACTFLLHRTYHPAHEVYARNPAYATSGIENDPFDPDEPDPNLTGAIDSSLWELQTLTQHYHPNVATLAKILGEQFTKREYALEDFLDHGPTTLIQAELGREVKRSVEVEWEIPKRIVTDEGGQGGLSSLGGMLERAYGVM